MSQALVDYLSTLNTSENQWSLYVNPSDLDDYRIGQDCFENGGLLDDKVCVGSLESLSFGFQSTYDAIESRLKYGDDLVFRGRKVNINVSGILEAYSNGDLAEDFQGYLEAEAEEIKKTWAEEEASAKVAELQEYFVPGGQYEQEQAQANAEAEAWECEMQQQRELQYDV